MKLIDCYIENYGKFSRRSFTFSDGLTCFYLPNGEGKTTFASFMKAMLYGLDGYRDTSREFCERKRFYPFSGGKFGGWLRIEWQGKVYTIERFFDKKSETKDGLRVYDGYGRACEDLGAVPGEKIFGVTLAAFERTSFLDAEKIGRNFEDGASEALGALIADASTKTFARAVGLLEEERKRLQSDRKTAGRYTGVLPELFEKIFTLEEELYALEKKQEEVLKKRARLAEVERKVRQMEAERIAFGEKNEGAYSPKAAQKKEARKPSFYKMLSLIFALLWTVVGGLVLKNNLTVSLVFFSLGAFSLVLGLTFLKKKPLSSGQGSNEKEHSYPKEEWISVFSALLEERALLKEEIALAERDCLLAVEKKERIKELSEERERLHKKRRLLEVAKNKLLQADKNLKDGYFVPTSESFLRYARTFDEKRFSNVLLDGDLNCYFESGGQRRESGHYSDGEKTLLQFAMRLALLDNLYQGEKPFLVLDDPFVYLDEESLKKTEKALKSLAKDRQILYFCCHQSRCV